MIIVLSRGENIRGNLPAMQSHAKAVLALSVPDCSIGNHFQDCLWKASVSWLWAQDHPKGNASCTGISFNVMAGRRRDLKGI